MVYSGGNDTAVLWHIRDALPVPDCCRCVSVTNQSNHDDDDDVWLHNAARCRVVRLPMQSTIGTGFNLHSSTTAPRYAYYQRRSGSGFHGDVTTDVIVSADVIDAGERRRKISAANCVTSRRLSTERDFGREFTDACARPGCDEWLRRQSRASSEGAGRRTVAERVERSSTTADIDVDDRHRWRRRRRTVPAGQHQWKQLRAATNTRQVVLLPQSSTLSNLYVTVL